MATTTYRNVAGLNQALRKLPKIASAKLRDASVSIAAAEASRARSLALRVGGVARLVEPTIKATRDRVPVIKMGDTRMIPGRNARPNSANQTIGNLIWGAEFGGGKRPTTTQFKAHLGHTGYFLWPTIRHDSDEIDATYSEALADALAVMH